VTHLIWSEDLGKRIRSGTWDEQLVPTVDEVEKAISEGRGEIAAQLVDYFMEEAKVCHLIYETWTPGFLSWLQDRGVTDEELDSQVDRLHRLLAMPDGTPFDTAALWDALSTRAGRLANMVRGDALAPDEAIAEMEVVREDWRQLHDRWVDLMSGILTYGVERFGEESLESMYRHTLESYVQERYMPYDLRERDYAETIFRNLYTSIEAMRAHLCGPERRGTMDFEEHEDRWVISFDPCGSGGRSSRGDPVEGTGPRTEPPYRFGVTQGEHDWAWNETGICYYCAHCCFALELLPAERWGHPVRVVDSPRYPGETTGDAPAQCTWTVYKSLEAIPEEAYLRIGRTKPKAPSGNTPPEPSA
jgi:hypothetical protein